ncbi:unknown [Acinetobacter sp. CAG:196]|jgi:hypothetical protein|nr:unknown [Acinetobacter sp. CAG:196]
MIINSGLVDSYPRPSPQGEGGEDNMQGRTFFRIMLDIVLNNALVKSLASLVNFCNELRYYNRKELKFLKKMPINNNVVKEEYYKNRFIFNSITGNRTSSK